MENKMDEKRPSPILGEVATTLVKFDWSEHPIAVEVVFDGETWVRTHSEEYFEVMRRVITKASSPPRPSPSTP